MPIRTLLFSGVLFLSGAAVSASEEHSVFQLLRQMEKASQSEAASERMGAYLRQIIRAELAAAQPVFCPPPGGGQVDGKALWDFAIEQAPRVADQHRLSARSVVVGYLARVHPCK